MQDTFDKPHYTNVQMPFAGTPPHVPEANPTGIYERTFELPESWAGRRIVLHVGAAESLLVVHLNGTEVGLSKDLHLAAEFDLTDAVTSRARTPSACGSSSGPTPPISRTRTSGGTAGSPARCSCTPRAASTWPRSRRSAAWPTTCRPGTLEFRAEVGFAGIEPELGWTVETTLGELGDPVATVQTEALITDHGPDGTSLAQREVIARHAYGGSMTEAEATVEWPALERRIARPLDGLLSWRIEIPDVRPWSAEVPALYPLTVVLRSPTARSSSRRASGSASAESRSGASSCSSTARPSCSMGSTATTSTSSTAARPAAPRSAPTSSR